MLKRSISRVSIEDGDGITLDRVDIQRFRQPSDVEYSTDCESNKGGTFTPTVTLTSESYTHCSEYVRPILVGYAFGKKKMSTMGMIMAEASMEISTIIHTENNEYEQNDECSDKIQESSSIRVSFVPLDLDIPIHEQHGGQFDVILHKLTEDILSCTNDVPCCSAQDRIQSLKLYKQNRPVCCLVDHPNHILPVLGRDHMCNILKSCLVNVSTTSGLRVSTPQYLVLKNNLELTTIQEQLSKVSITYPIIVKPLAAAGTVQSHKMSILFSKHALNRICGSPVLLQQYTNHDSLLYKVYVLGDTVWVFPRSSLPNLPTITQEHNSSYVEFDSQKPYPDLSAFCPTSKVFKKPKIKHKVTITAQEVQPIVKALRKSFQLELFGFDVLLHTDGNEIMVVDVNYFPSYKEVLNFPKYLARYLTKRAIDARKQS